MSQVAGQNPFPHRNLSENLIAFSNHLRQAQQKFNLGPQEVQDGLRALGAVNLGSVQEVRLALKLVMCANLEQERVFDDLFFQFFLPLRRRGPAKASPKKTLPGDAGQAGEKAPSPSSQNDPAEAELEAAASGIPKVSEGEAESWSASLLKTIFSRTAGADSSPIELPQENLEEMLRAASKLIECVRLGRNRRWDIASKGPRFDFRRTIRKGLQTGGEFIHTAWLAHPRRQPRFVFILDGSRSMQGYADKLLQFAFALRMRSARVEVFSFSTELKRITRELEACKSLTQRPQLAGLGQAWGGGTRIGESLYHFEHRYGGLVRGDTVLMIASDGLDTGEPGVLEYALRQLHLQSAALVWLNPLLSVEGYDPKANCMKTALPYLDKFCSAHTPEEFAHIADGIRLRR
ncbi:MAG: VWA domain-containing protein [Thermaceae bacterium]|nr:VWA domain-containing protein [Thermaceae bacterium]